MALNPPLLPGNPLPLPVTGELFILSRTGIRLECHMRGQVPKKYDEKGTLYLSTLRMVFVKDPRSNGNAGWFGLGGGPPSDLVAFDLPFSLIRDERFNQPIFGCNNLDGVCLPLPGTDGPSHYKLSFQEGGVGTLLPLYWDLLNRNRRGGSAANPDGFADFSREVASGEFMRKAYVDPNDPSTIFVSSQPATPQAQSQSREDYYRFGPPRPPSQSSDSAPSPIPTGTPLIIPTATSVAEAPSAPPPGWSVVSKTE